MHIPKYWTNTWIDFYQAYSFTLSHKPLKHDCLLTSIFNFLLDIIDILVSGVDHYFQNKKSLQLRSVYFLISYWWIFRFFNLSTKVSVLCLSSSCFLGGNGLLPLSEFPYTPQSLTVFPAPPLSMDLQHLLCKNYPEKWAGFKPVSSAPITSFTAWSSSFSWKSGQTPDRILQVSANLLCA